MMKRSDAGTDLVPSIPHDDDWSDRNSAVVALGLSWLRELLGDYVSHLRAERPAARRSAGAQPVLTDVEADWLLRDGAGCGYPAGDRAATARQSYDAARKAMRVEGRPAAIDRLADIFGLSEFETDVVLMTAAPYAEAAFSALYGYAHDRMSIDRPTPHLACALVSGGEPAATALGRRLLAPDAPLRRHGLINGTSEHLTALTPLVTDEVLARYVRGEDCRDTRLRHLLMPIERGPCTASMISSARRLVDGIGAHRAGGALVCGPPRSGRREIAALVAEEMGLGLRELRLSLLPVEGLERLATFRLLARESRLRDTAVLVDLSQIPSDASAPREPSAKAIAEDLLAESATLVIFAATQHHELPGPMPSVWTAAIEEDERAALWRSAWPTVERSPGLSADRLAQHFQIGPTEIAQVCARVATTMDGVDLWRACRESASRGLDAMAEGIAPKFGWDDIVLPDDIRADLEAIVAQVRHRSAVYGKGGFARKLVRGRGVSALFAGPSGVGKTMAAEVIARDLDLDLYRIDLSRVISKYIGETEQNLRRVFDAAEAGGAVLFFDEADALFGKRSEVKDSHDRYANIEISYLLQRMETYSGLAILATNLKSHIDAAFLRRLRFVIDLPFPDASLRERIWTGAFPDETATEGLDFRALSRLEVAGGNIVVIAVNAAFLAAGDGKPVRMDHIARAARAEMRKLDKQFRPSWPVGGP